MDSRDGAIYSGENQYSSLHTYWAGRLVLTVLPLCIRVSQIIRAERCRHTQHVQMSSSPVLHSRRWWHDRVDAEN